MAEASREGNRITTLLGVSSADGVTPVRIWANEITHALLVETSGGAGTVTDFIFTNANGISGTVATSTTTPTLTLSLGAITPSSVNGNTITTGTGTLTLSTFTLTVSGNGSVQGSNTGDQSLSGLVPYTGATGDVTLGVHKLTAQNESITQFTELTGIADPAPPAAGFDRLYAQLGVDGLARLTTMSAAGFPLTINRDMVQRVFNPSVSTFPKGSAVYVIGQSGGAPTIALSKADLLATADVSGILISAAAPSGFATMQIEGVAQSMDTSAFNAGDNLWLSDTVAGGLQTTAPIKPSIVVPVGTVLTKNATTGTIFLDITNNPPISLVSLTDTAISSPVVDQFLRYNGTDWVNSAVGSSSAGVGISFYNASPSIIATGTQNTIQLLTFSKTPVVTAEQTKTGTGNSLSTPVPYSAWLYDTALGRTVIDGGVWTFTSWANIDNATGTTTISRVVYAVLDEGGGSTVRVTTIGGDTTTLRSATSSGGTPFASAKVDVGGTALTDSYLKTTKGLLRIVSRDSDTVVHVATPATYTDDVAGMAFSVWKKVVYSGESPDINTTTASGNYDNIILTVAAAPYTITTAHKLGAISFVTSSASRTVTTTYDGTARNSRIETPLVTLHNNLAGLQGGTGSGVTGEYFHLTSAEYTATATTGSGNFARLTSPAFTTPNIGSATGSVSGNAGTVTNATLTTALTVNTGTVTLTGNSGGSTLTLGAGSSSVSGANTGDQTSLPIVAAPSAGTCSGIIITLTSTETQAVGDACMIDTNGKAHLAKADAIANAGAIVMAAHTVTNSASNTYLTHGVMKLASGTPFTVGSIVYLSATGTTGNTLTHTPPSSANNVIQPLGVAIATDTILFNPNLTMVEHV